MKKEYFYYIGAAAALFYIFKLRQTNKELFINCGYADKTLTISETITEN